MTGVTYNWKNASLTGIVDNPSVILTNSAGSFAHFGNKPTSKFQGFFIQHLRHVYKTIEAIEMPGDIESIETDFVSVTRKRPGYDESFFLPSHRDALCHKTSTPTELLLTLDCRKDADFREFGRLYKIYTKDDVIIVKFTKQTNKGEDRSHNRPEFKIYLAVKSDGSYGKKSNWVRRVYSDDQARHSHAERYVFQAIQLKASTTVFAASLSEHAAVAEAKYCYRHFNDLQKELSQKASLEETAAQHAFDSLTGSGIYAGLPWFHQYWSRDTLIALPAAHPYLQKRIILNYIRMLRSDGRLLNVTGSQYNRETLGSSDAVGWLFFRAQQLYKRKVFNDTEIREITKALRTSLLQLEKHHFRDGLVFSGRNETWMDTSFNDNGREGFPIEIQALTLASYRFLSELTSPVRKEKKLANLVKGKFWNNSQLLDMADSSDVRPNLFIAAYVYPQLLTKKEWERAIEAVLPRLWLDWGGLSSLDKTNPLFQPYYTGEDDRSYHRGDSWYWLNNIAAIVMHRINRKKFRGYINKIREASVQDLLWQGALGGCSEISSASEQTASGCLNQAWSDSTLLELLKEVK